MGTARRTNHTWMILPPVPVSTRGSFWTETTSIQGSSSLIYQIISTWPNCDRQRWKFGLLLENLFGGYAIVAKRQPKSSSTFQRQTLFRQLSF